MGAKIYQENENKIVVEGVEKLQASEIYANDLRGSMALIIAAIMANDTSTLYNAFYTERGYENFIEKLTKIGVKIFIK